MMIPGSADADRRGGPPAGGQAGNVQQEADPGEVDAITKRLELACYFACIFPPVAV
jgi:hypothetical protein